MDSLKAVSDAVNNLLKQTDVETESLHQNPEREEKDENNRRRPTKYFPQNKQEADYHPTVESLGESKRAFDTVPDFYKPEVKLTLTKGFNFSFKVDNYMYQFKDMEKLHEWLITENRGKILCKFEKEHHYYIVLKYEKRNSSTSGYEKNYGLIHCSADVINSIDALARTNQLIPTLYHNPSKGKLTKFRITWLD